MAQARKNFIRLLHLKSSRKLSLYPSITCPVCGMTSYNVNDIREGYCGKCHAFTGRPEQFDACLRGRHGSQEQEGPTPAQEHAMGFAAVVLVKLSDTWNAVKNIFKNKTP